MKAISILILVITLHLIVFGGLYLSGDSPEVSDSTTDLDPPMIEEVGTKTVKVETTPLFTPPKTISHTIQKGEYLSTIAKKYDVNVKEICSANNITNPNSIRIGQKLTIPLKK